MKLLDRTSKGVWRVEAFYNVETFDPTFFSNDMHMMTEKKFNIKGEDLKNFIRHFDTSISNLSVLVLENRYLVIWFCNRHHNCVRNVIEKLIT